MKTKIIMTVMAMALSASASAEVIKEKQLYCHDIFSMQRVDAAFKSGDKDAIEMVITNEKECHFTRKPVKVIKTMDWPDSQIKKVMIADPSMPDLAGFELWTFGFSLSRK
jgi:coenzyme F420-reducing hydrogenase delta subunit